MADLRRGQLTLEHLNSGEYHLQVSNESQVMAGVVGLESRFEVLKPWYLSQLAILGFSSQFLRLSALSCTGDHDMLCKQTESLLLRSL